MTYAIEVLDLGVAYATWSGVGTALTAVVGVSEYFNLTHMYFNKFDFSYIVCRVQRKNESNKNSCTTLRNSIRLLSSIRFRKRFKAK